MATITYSVPDCQTPWPCTTPPEVLLRLILLHARTADPADPAPATAPTPAKPGAKVEKVKWPMVMAARTNEDWSYLMLLWSVDKAATHISGIATDHQLLKCSDDVLWSCI